MHPQMMMEMLTTWNEWVDKILINIFILHSPLYLTLDRQSLSEAELLSLTKEMKVIVLSL